MSRGWAGSLRTARRSVDIADIGCVYYRKPSVFRFPDGMSQADRRWAMREARIGLELNPNGQWAWIQEKTGLPIAVAIADALQGAQPS